MKNKNVGANCVRPEKGITLIALVITIIIMLILVGVTINLSANGGLFNYARTAKGDTKNAIAYEQGLANIDLSQYVNPSNTYIGKAYRIGFSENQYMIYNGETATMYSLIDDSVISTIPSQCIVAEENTITISGTGSFDGVISFSTDFQTMYMTSELLSMDNDYIGYQIGNFYDFVDNSYVFDVYGPLPTGLSGDGLNVTASDGPWHIENYGSYLAMWRSSYVFEGEMSGPDIMCSPRGFGMIYEGDGFSGFTISSDGSTIKDGSSCAFIESSITREIGNNIHVLGSSTWGFDDTYFARAVVWMDVDDPILGYTLTADNPNNPYGHTVIKDDYYNGDGACFYLLDEDSNIVENINYNLPYGNYTLQLIEE